MNLEDYNEKQLFMALRSRIGFHRDPDFIKWFHKRFPNMECHHLVGSVFGRKYSDYLVIPVSRELHKECEPKIGDTFYRKARACKKYLPEALMILRQYYLEKTGKKYDYINDDIIKFVVRITNDIYLLDNKRELNV